MAIERGIGDILISISHCRTYATAYALALASAKGAMPLAEDEAEDDPG